MEESCIQQRQVVADTKTWMALSLELHALRRATTGSHRWWMAPLLLAVVVYLVLSLWLAHTKAPWCDEAWFVNPAFNLAFHGRMGSNVLEPSGHYLNAYLRGVQERTYIFPPNHLVALAGWFRLFGFSAFRTRVYSVCWSAVGLAALFYILLRIFPDHRVAQLAALLIAIDFIFLWSTADGRPEAMANSLAICSVAAYLHFRESSLGKAILISQIFAAGAVFAHLNALLVVLSLTVVAWCLDRKRLRWRYLLLAAAPYVFFGLLWSLYILQKPEDFIWQFFPQAGYSERWKGILRPDIAIGTEIDRHLAAYSIDGLWTAVMSGWTIIVPFLYFSAVMWFFRTRGRLARAERMFLVFTVVLMTGMTFLNGFKGYFYLIYIVPIYDTVLALWLLSLWTRSREGRWAASAIALAFAIAQLSMSIQHIRADEYHREYEPTVRDLEKYRDVGKSILGTAALGFGLHFSGFKDDIREGTYSGLAPDVLVVDRSYRQFAGMFEKNEPKVFAHIVVMLASTYRLAAQHGSFWILERVPPGANGDVLPWIDVEEIQTVEQGKRAEYFFRLMLSKGKMRRPDGSSLSLR
jgi:hypothetical protein